MAYLTTNVILNYNKIISKTLFQKDGVRRVDCGFVAYLKTNGILNYNKIISKTLFQKDGVRRVDCGFVAYLKTNGILNYNKIISKTLFQKDGVRRVDRCHNFVWYNTVFQILILTLKKAFPSMLRFLACCIMLYIGFVVCGWVVLGPYHIKVGVSSKNNNVKTSNLCL